MHQECLELFKEEKEENRETMKERVFLIKTTKPPCIMVNPVHGPLGGVFNLVKLASIRYKCGSRYKVNMRINENTI